VAERCEPNFDCLSEQFLVLELFYHCGREVWFSLSRVSATI
jgi:hypothetical protein